MPRPPLFQRATVTRVVRESDDASTFVLVPHGGPFTYRAGQFCTFRIRVGEEDVLRSYSMSSAPETDDELMTTVKRVPGGQVSNWLHDNLAEGDVVEITEPRGVFCLRETDRPLLGFSGGSGLTPIVSLAKSALATTGRRVRLLCADRDAGSVLFDAVTSELAARYPDRFEMVRHLDAERGFLDEDAIRAFVGADGDADAYLCGPEPFMALVERAWPGPGEVFVERFGSAPDDRADAGAAGDPDPAVATQVEGEITIILGRKKVTVPRRPNETFLETARRAGLNPPFSCESGTCATCIALLEKGEATMRNNEALEDDEVADGYILTCQGVPDTPSATVRYED